MKTISFLILIFVSFLLPFTEKSSIKTEDLNGKLLTPGNPANVKLSGHAGEQIDLCISKRIQKQDIEHLIEPFRTKTETRLWQSEFWGKWMLSAVAAYKYKPEPELLNSMKNAVAGILETQLPNGYIGNYATESQLT